MNTYLTRLLGGETCEPSALQYSCKKKTESSDIWHPASGQGLESGTVSRICNLIGAKERRKEKPFQRNHFKCGLGDFLLRTDFQVFPCWVATEDQRMFRLCRLQVTEVNRICGLNTKFIFCKFGFEIHCYTDDTQLCLCNNADSLLQVPCHK